MVAPKGDALTCAQCHDASTGGRLKNVKGIYMPGRGDNNKLLDIGGLGACAPDPARRDDPRRRSHLHEQQERIRSCLEKIYVFKLFERFWHWSQASLIIFMLITGFEVHGSYSLFGFAKAVSLHTIAAWTLIGLWVFAIFWHFTTGEWKQYIPTMDKVVAMIKFYSVGIFIHAPHPFKATQLKKHNPLQRLAYLGVLLFIGPLLWLSGWFYLFFGDVAGVGRGQVSSPWNGWRSSIPQARS